MNIIKNIKNRVSYKKLKKPYPSSSEMELIYEAALRAPDHRNLKPSHFIEVTGKGLDKLSNLFVKYAKNDIEDLNDIKLNKIKNAPYRAPMIIVLISKITEHPKVPKIEQMLSTAAATQNILLSLDSLGYGAVWRTGSLALNNKINKYFSLDEKDEIIGYLYVGTPDQESKKINKPNISEHIKIWK